MDNNETDAEHSNGSADNDLSKPNIVMVGIMGCGKTTVGERLALSLGFGFMDIDYMIEKHHGKKIDEIFAEEGESEFRQYEKTVIGGLKQLRNHVISVGGGAIADEDNWHLLQEIATVIWVNTPVEEIARRIVMSPDEIRKRPLIREFVTIEDKNERQKLLSERLQAIMERREKRYREADYIVEDAYSTPETTLQKLRNVLTSDGAI